jgi:hypothetical protein
VHICVHAYIHEEREDGNVVVSDMILAKTFLAEEMICRHLGDSVTVLSRLAKNQ